MRMVFQQGVDQKLSLIGGQLVDIRTELVHDCPCAVLFVVSEGSTRQTDVMKARELLESVNVLGTVLNQSDVKTASYY